ncbi:MAG: hypothetical protein K0R09_1655 [Clostridiales bacterium]|jgi:Zn-dependent metalloprotease|nr:hypothetical protein [Clostridiales bacterium]
MKKLISLVASTLVILLMVVTPVAKAVQHTDSPRWASSISSEKFSKNMDGVVQFFNNNKDKFYIEDAEREFVKVKEIVDELGYTHIKVKQVVEGIEVWGNEYFVHFDKEGVVYLVNGRYDSNARIHKIDRNTISPESAIEIAQKEVICDSLEMLPETKLYLYKLDEIYVPVYQVRINFLYPEPGDWFIFVNAYDGTIVDKYNNYKTSTLDNTIQSVVLGTGIGVLGDQKSIYLNSASGKYTLTDRSKPMYSYGGEILTYDAGYRYRIPGTIMSDTDTVFNSSRQRAGVDAHYYAGFVYNYYYTTFGRNSIDNYGMDIKSTVHYGSNYANAGWTGSQMVYGDGDGVNYRAFSGALDVIAHELTHGVTDYEAGLIYSYQSGALNESFSDVFGVIAEYEAGNWDWLMGEDIMISGGAFRDVSNPTAYGDPDHMDDYVNTTSDNGGVHTNSGIPNKAAYNAYVNLGGNFDKLERIYYRALTQILTTSSDFSDARQALMQAAYELYGDTERTAIANAFSAVGVY